MADATFDAIKIGIASPEMIRKWSFGDYLRDAFHTLIGETDPQ